MGDPVSCESQFMLASAPLATCMLDSGVESED